MRNYIAIEGTDLIFTEKEWEKKKHTYNTRRIVRLGEHKNREAARDYYILREMYPWEAEAK